MNNDQKKEIKKISKQFAAGFKDTLGSINGTGWLIVDPLSAYLNAMGFENKVKQLPATDDRPQILILIFPDGSQFIPAGGDLKPVYEKAKNWMWL